MSIIKPSISCDMSVIGYENGQMEFFDTFKTYADTLLVSPRDLLLALQCVQSSSRAPRDVVVVAVPHMAADAWMLVGSSGVLYNHGA